MEAPWTIANLLTGGRAVRVDATVEPGIYSLDAVRKNLFRPSRRMHCVEGPRDRDTDYLVAPQDLIVMRPRSAILKSTSPGFNRGLECFKSFPDITAKQLALSYYRTSTPYRR
jgi:hypothetical protein